MPSLCCMVARTLSINDLVNDSFEYKKLLEGFHIKEHFKSVTI